MFGLAFNHFKRLLSNASGRAEYGDAFFQVVKFQLTKISIEVRIANDY
jgi:hypothetical protein